LALVPNGLLIISPVAFKRFADMVPMTIDQELLRGLDWNRGLHSDLTKGLEITGPGSLDKAKEYLQEPPDVKSRRESLSKKCERLLSAKRELQSLGSFHPINIPPPPGESEDPLDSPCSIREEVEDCCEEYSFGIYSVRFIHSRQITCLPLGPRSLELIIA